MVRTLKKALWRIRPNRERDVLRKVQNARKRGETVVLTRDETRIMFDRMVLRQLHMSGDEFLRRLDVDDLPDSPGVEHFVILAGRPRAR